MNIFRFLFPYFGNYNANVPLKKHIKQMEKTGYEFESFNINNFTVTIVNNDAQVGFKVEK